MEKKMFVEGLILQEKHAFLSQRKMSRVGKYKYSFQSVHTYLNTYRNVKYKQHHSLCNPGM